MRWETVPLRGLDCLRIHRMKTQNSTLRWLLDSDPSLRSQVLRDLTDESEPEVAAPRTRVGREGAGARILALQAPDGR